MKQIIFGQYKLNIGQLVNCAGNAYFHKRKTSPPDYIKVCKLITATLGKDYFDQKGAGKRVWPTLSDNDVFMLNKAADAYNARLSN